MKAGAWAKVKREISLALPDLLAARSSTRRLVAPVTTAMMAVGHWLRGGGMRASLLPPLEKRAKPHVIIMEGHYFGTVSSFVAPQSTWERSATSYWCELMWMPFFTTLCTALCISRHVFQKYQMCVA